MMKFAIARNRGRACLHEELFMLKTIINYGLKLVYLIVLLYAITNVDVLTATINNIKPVEARISHFARLITHVSQRSQSVFQRRSVFQSNLK